MQQPQQRRLEQGRPRAAGDRHFGAAHRHAADPQRAGDGHVGVQRLDPPHPLHLGVHLDAHEAVVAAECLALVQAFELLRVRPQDEGVARRSRRFGECRRDRAVAGEVRRIDHDMATQHRTQHGQRSRRRPELFEQARLGSVRTDGQHRHAAARVETVERAPSTYKPTGGSKGYASALRTMSTGSAMTASTGGECALATTRRARVASTGRPALLEAQPPASGSSSRAARRSRRSKSARFSSSRRPASHRVCQSSASAAISP